MADVPAFQRLNVVRDGRTLYAGSESTLSGAIAFSGPNAMMYALDLLVPQLEQRATRASRSRTSPTPNPSLFSARAVAKVRDTPCVSRTFASARRQGGQQAATWPTISACGSGRSLPDQRLCVLSCDLKASAGG